MKRAIVLALLLAAPAAAATLPSPNWPAPADRGGVLLRTAVLKAQNEARARFGVAPMAWSDELAAEALGHAQYMASTGIYGHDQTPGRRKKQGENRIERMANGWGLPGGQPDWAVGRRCALHPDRLAKHDPCRVRRRVEHDDRLFRLSLFAHGQQGRPVHGRRKPTSPGRQLAS